MKIRKKNKYKLVIYVELSTVFTDKHMTKMINHCFNELKDIGLVKNIKLLWGTMEYG